MITRALVLTVFVFTAIFLGSVQQAYGQTRFDFFSPTKSDEDRKAADLKDSRTTGL